MNFLVYFDVRNLDINKVLIKWSYINIEFGFWLGGERNCSKEVIYFVG